MGRNTIQTHKVTLLPHEYEGRYFPDETYHQINRLLRTPRKEPIYPADIIQVFTTNRLGSPSEYIFSATVTACFDVTLRWPWQLIDGGYVLSDIPPDESPDYFAQSIGLHCFYSIFDIYQPDISLPFYGVIIQWSSIYA